MVTNNKLFVSITLDFQQHTTGAYRAVHHKLNAHYGGIIHDITTIGYPFHKDPDAIHNLQHELIQQALPLDNISTSNKQNVNTHQVDTPFYAFPNSLGSVISLNPSF